MADCNMGLEPLIGESNVPALTRHRRGTGQKRTICGLKLSTSAHARLVDFQATLLYWHRYGVEEVASADGMRFHYASQNNQCRTGPQILW
ncbi:Tn3 family transposase [Enterobacter sp. CPE_E222]|uniref:Tn3 family transposase n=1 Tax=Enterobacter sp. CPE_E222 TaxID=3383890 RepID=UPI003974DA79